MLQKYYFCSVKFKCTDKATGKVCEGTLIKNFQRRNVYCVNGSQFNSREFHSKFKDVIL